VERRVLGEYERRGSERVGLEDVRARFEVLAMDRGDHVGARQVELLVAPVEFVAAEIRGGEVARLNGGAHRPVEAEDALGKSVGNRCHWMAWNVMVSNWGARRSRAETRQVTTSSPARRQAASMRGAERPG